MASCPTGVKNLSMHFVLIETVLNLKQAILLFILNLFNSNLSKYWNQKLVRFESVSLDLLSYVQTFFNSNYLLLHVKILTFSFIIQEGCSNMNVSGFIIFVTYMLRQNGIRFYKRLYVTLKLATDLKKNTVYLSSYSPLLEGHFIILTSSMLRTCQ